MDPIERLRALGADGAAQFVQRYGRAPLALALEHLPRFPMRPDNFTPGAPGVSAAGNTRSREMVMAAAPKSMQLGEFIGCGWTCGYFKNADGLAIIPVWGDLGPMRAWRPWVWYEDLAAAADGAAKDGDVKAILFHIDSPGGHVTGLAECAAAIERAAAAKPCAAYAHDYATSAAYWIAAATGAISAPVSGIVGSIGTLCVHEEVSEALNDAGFKVTVVRSDARKAEANFFEPLTTQALNALQHEVALCADQFKSAIARLRGLDVVAISATQAACIPMDQATAQRFADRTEDFSAAIAALMQRASPALAATPPAASSPASAAAKPPAAQAKAAAKKPPAQSRASTKPTARAVSSRANIRSNAMDPTTLPVEEQAARRAAIAEVIAVEPADENEAAAQFLQIVTIVNAPAEGAEETTTEEPAPEGEAPAAGAAASIAASAFAKSHPQLAVEAIKTGMSLKQFEAAAKLTPKQGGGFQQKMQGVQGAQPVGGGGNGGGGNTAAVRPREMPTTADAFKQRREARAGGRK